MVVRACRPAFARPYVGVHRSTSLMSSFLLLQQCPACLVRLTSIVFVMGGRWLYSWCLVRCCRQDLFNIACSILMYQLEHTFSSYVRIPDVALKTCQRRWTIGRSGERGSGISVLAARYHDDDDMVVDLTIVTLTEMLKRYTWVHRSSLAYEVYRNRTSFSNYMWKMEKNLGTHPVLKWEIVKNAVCVLYSPMQYHTDTIIKQTQEDFFNKIFTSHFISRVRKGLLKFCVWKGAGDRTELQYFDPHSYGHQRCVFLVLLMLNRRPWGSLCWVLAFFTASYQHLLWTPNSIGVPEGPLGRAWLSLPHLVYNSVNNSTATRTQLSWLSYIIVQRPLDHPLDLWNRMFNRHRAEITVMQFRGHSLPVRQSISWDFLACPTRFPLLTAIGMCHFLPVHHLEWHFGPGRRSKYNTCK